MDRQGLREQTQDQVAATLGHRVRVYEKRRQEGKPRGPFRAQV